jgi:hypothetical protein
VRLTQPHAWAAAVLVDELDAGCARLRCRHGKTAPPRAPAKLQVQATRTISDYFDCFG